MKISFVLIAYNEEKIISQCVEAIEKQDYKVEHEIIVVNDGSTDKTADLVKELADKNEHIVFINFEQNKGRGFARKAGVEAATGDYIAFIDADIVIPSNWLTLCIEEIKNADAVGGIAVPDGDVTFIFNTFQLAPRIKNHTVSVSGGNGLYKASLLKEQNFDASLKDGEDVEMNKRLAAAHCILKTIPNLIVMHHESKDFNTSMKWLYQSGIGATRQLKRYREIRLPDIAFGIFLSTIGIGLALTIFTKEIQWLLPTLLFPLCTSALHIYTKFDPNKSKFDNYMNGIFLNYPLICAYYAGRIRGLFNDTY